MAFTFATTWNTGDNNDLSFQTGKPTTNHSDQFSQDQISDLLKTAETAFIPSGNKEAEKLKKALIDGSSEVEIIKGAHQDSAPHITVRFQGKIAPWHINIKWLSNSKWEVTEIPAQQFMFIDQAQSYDDVLAMVKKALFKMGDQLLAHPDVHGVGIAYKYSGGKETNELCILVHVEEKIPSSALEAHRILPKAISYAAGNPQKVHVVSIDVQAAPLPEKQGICDPFNEELPKKLKEKVRPVPGGYNIGRYASLDPNGGTLGAWVWDEKQKTIVLLSNDHVLNKNGQRDIIQPSNIHKGTKSDIIATYTRTAEPILDASIATPVDAKFISETIECIGEAVFEIETPKVGMQVVKVGSKTGKTIGKITSINYKSQAFPQYGFINIYVKAEGKPFSDRGDSGSVYVVYNEEKVNTIIGLHWGGDGRDGFGFHIKSVFEELNLSTLPKGLIGMAFEAAITASLAEDTSIQIPEKLRFPTHTHEEDFIDDLKRDLLAILESNRLSKTNSDLMGFLQKNKSIIATAMLDKDVWRACIIALLPLLNGRVTTHEILDHKIDTQDIKNFHRVSLLIKRAKPELLDAVNFFDHLINQAEGNSLEELLRMPFFLQETTEALGFDKPKAKKALKSK